MANVPISAFTVPANTVGIGATGYSLTGSASASFMDLAGTWNTSGTPTAIKLNINNTASNAASLLMDLQVGGASKFNMDTQGRANIRGIDPQLRLAYLNESQFIINQGILIAANNYQFAWSSSSTGVTTVNADLILTRRGAANLRLGAADAAAPVAQTLSVQSVVAGTTNTAGTNFTITGSQGTGSGAGGSLIFQVAPAGAAPTVQNPLVTALTINSAGTATFASGVTLSSGNYSLGAGAGLTWTTRGSIYSAADGIISLYNNALSDFNRLQFGGITSSFPALKRSTTFLQARLADDSAACGFSAANVQAATAYTVATLPTPATGMIARVTDATAPTIGTTVAGGGAAYALVNYNGANWTVIGV